MLRAWLRGTLAAAILCAGISLLSGCPSLPSKEPHWVETNQLTFAYPVEDVYTLVVQGVEKNGRAIVALNTESRSILVSYPFSWLKNNWGGSLRITCVSSEFGTTVTILGDGRDTVPRVRAIGDEVLKDLGTALRRRPRTI